MHTPDKLNTMIAPIYEVVHLLNIDAFTLCDLVRSGELECEVTETGHLAFTARVLRDYMAKRAGLIA